LFRKTLVIYDGSKQASRVTILKKLMGDWLSTSQKLALLAPCAVLMVK